MEVTTRRRMITFRENGHRFTYRIAGIAIHNGRVLFQRADDSPVQFWFLPGGRAELSETSLETLTREMQEELGVGVIIERLLYVVENFFEYPHNPHHEIGFYFLVAFPPDSYLYHQPGPFERHDELDRLNVFTWIPISEFEHHLILPLELREVLQQPIPAHTQHVINKHNEAI